MNGYVGFYKGKRYEVYAESLLAARDKIAELAKAKKAYEVNVVLAEKDGEVVVHSPAEF
jgi:hypothetical protein